MYFVDGLLGAVGSRDWVRATISGAEASQATVSYPFIVPSPPQKAEQAPAKKPEIKEEEAPADAREEASNKSPTPEEQPQTVPSTATGDASSPEAADEAQDEPSRVASTAEEEKAQSEALNCCGVSIAVE